MSSILDIDLDYFNLCQNPEQQFYELLNWGCCPIAFVVEKHHKAYSRWKDRVKRETLTEPSHILHVDEHHDMMDQKRNTNIGNFMYHAMRIWKNCRVHWMVDTPIDSPEMWLDDDVWVTFSQRFSMGSNRPRGWPKPDIVSICTSPEFINDDLLQRLLKTSKEFMTGKQRSDIEKTKCRTSQFTRPEKPGRFSH
jgi:hypothetical protein